MWHTRAAPTTATSRSTTPPLLQDPRTRGPPGPHPTPARRLASRCRSPPSISRPAPRRRGLRRRRRHCLVRAVHMHRAATVSALPSTRLRARLRLPERKRSLSCGFEQPIRCGSAWPTKVAHAPEYSDQGKAPQLLVFTQCAPGGWPLLHASRRRHLHCTSARNPGKTEVLIACRRIPSRSLLKPSFPRQIEPQTR